MIEVNAQALEPDWRAALAGEFECAYMRELRAFLQAEQRAGKCVYPPASQVFNAFNSTPLSGVKVVILGQDPYHGPGQAHGLSFSVPEGVGIPPSLRNIFKELERDLGLARPQHGNLQAWAAQGVLLLNATLTVEQGRAGSHQKRGWESFTDRAIEVLNQHQRPLVFLLWGGYAHKKARLIDNPKHTLLRAPHPSPLSAHRGFLGCGHFSQANKVLLAQGQTPIDWRL
jgi:uracil-DNA glycosylase